MGGLAQGFDDLTGRYEGLWLPDDNGAPPNVSAATLVVQPKTALEQRRKDEDEDQDQDENPSQGSSPTRHLPGPTPPVPAPAPVKRHFFGAKTLSTSKEAVDFKQIFDEILPHLRGGGLSVRVEIEADHSVGFDESARRTVAENAATLKFDQFGFEE